jgi:uncharacterized protein (DUF427 family)
MTEVQAKEKEPMAIAIWQGRVLAESNETIVVEGNHYFPLCAVNREYIKPSQTHTTCHWKGTASYYNVVVNGRENKDAAWYYPTPSDKASQIAGYVAFWHGVEVKT